MEYFFQPYGGSHLGSWTAYWGTGWSADEETLYGGSEKL